MATAMETETRETTVTRNGTSVVTEPAGPSTKKKIILGAVAIVAILVLIWAFQRWSYGRSHESTDNAQIDGHIVPVLAKVGAYVKTVSVDENDHVKAGQVLVQLEDDDYRVRLQQAQAD